MEKDVHVTLVREVEKYECLYNSTLPEYARKSVTEKAWLEISKTMQLPVRECKLKWRNIRSSFQRSLKPGRNAKPKRTYYLCRHLNFVVPFCKLMDSSTVNEDNASSQEDISSKGEDSEDSDDDEVSTSPQQQDAIDSCQDGEDVKLNPFSAPHSSEEDFSMPEHLMKSEREGNHYQTEKQEHMRYFFLSLLPEFSDMTERQTRTFKIKLLQLIDDIKTQSPVTSSTVK